MVTELFEKNILIYAMVGFCGLGVLTKLMLSLVYSGLVRASDKMGTSKRKLMKNICEKFEASYSFNMKVNNVDIFVDKYVYKHRFCGILLYSWECFCGLLLLLCMLTGSLGALLAVLYESSKYIILNILFAGAATSALLVFVDNMANLSVKRGVVKVNVQDYLENSLKVRLDSEKAKTPEERIAQAEENKVNEEERAQLSEKLEQDVSNLYDIDKREEKIIKDILKEYIV